MKKLEENKNYCNKMRDYIFQVLPLIRFVEAAHQAKGFRFQMPLIYLTYRPITEHLSI